jgi:chromosome transmission fidelity protein 4
MHYYLVEILDMIYYSELSVKLVDIEDNTKIIILNGHKRGVRKATWHPSGSLLATSGSDGNIIVWDVSEDQAKQANIIEGVIPLVPDTEYARLFVVL